MPEHPGIFFKDEGEGFPVLLIHGFCETHAIWKSLSNKLSKNNRVISIDLPGFGKSPLLPTPFSIDDVAEKVLEWLSFQQINNCIVIGHSLGGYVTLSMVGKRPQLFKAFGLFHSTAYSDSSEKKLSRNKVIEFVSNNGVQPFIESFIPPLFYNQTNLHIPDVVELALETRMETLLSYVSAMRDRPDTTNVLGDFGGPILFIAGDKDGVVSPESLQQQSLLASEPTLLIMPETAHMGMFENEPLILNQIQFFLG